MTKSKKTINNTVNNLFQDKCFIVFMLFVFIFYIFFYDYLDITTKKNIFLTFTNPIILLITICLIGLVLYHNFTLGIILAISLTITMTFNTTSNNNNNNNNKSLEGFKNKGYLMSKIEKLTNSLEEGLEENKDILDKYKKGDLEEDTSNEAIQNKNTNKTNKNSKKDIKIKKRKFDFTKREDKALVYSREVLKDCIKRINYEYDDKDYLKKYISSKIEELIDLLGLVDDKE
jgi:hypothetical protein